MKSTTFDVINELTLAEASAWLTRLQDSPRTPATEAAFKEWLASDSLHARAFTRVNDVWEQLPGAAALTQRSRAVRQRAHARRRTWLLASACAALLLATAGLIRMQAPAEHIYQTATGAQQIVVLEDNTRITLNTDTRIIVEYDKGMRRVRLEHGEAHFQVAKNLQRPFVVQTGDVQVVDLGTVYDVRHYSKDIAVTLLEGKVWVGAQTAPPGHPALSTVLVPGDRLTIQANGKPVLDRPSLQEAMAWQHGKIYFNNTTLADAVTELNRYGGVRIRIADPALAALRVSGVFSVHDTSQFASAVASLHELHAEHAGGAIVLAR